MPKDDPLHITFCPSVTATKRNAAENQYKELQNYCQFLKLRKISIINPRCACAARVTVLGLCVCVCVYAYFRAMGNKVDGERYQRL